MTANAMVGDREKVLVAGMNDHIAKPLNVASMFETMARWIIPAQPSADTGSASAARTGSALAEAPAPAGRPAPEALPESPPAIPAIPGIDTVRGLATTMDNPALYRRLLGRFRDSQADFPSAFRRAQGEADTEAPARLAHTLKGTAGNIGAREIQDRAGELEAACKAGAPAEAIEALLQATQSALDPVIGALRALERPEPAAAAGGDALVPRPGVAGATAEPARVRALAQRLDSLLRDMDAQAVEVLGDLQRLTAGSAFDEPLAAVARALDDYDFDAALESLDATASLMEGPCLR